MLVLTHPRSGSTEISRLIQKIVARNYNGIDILNLGEIFNYASKSGFGNIIWARDALVRNNNSIVANLIEFRDNIQNGEYLERVDVSFTSLAELNDWYQNEYSRRANLISQMEEPYIIKHFINDLFSFKDREIHNLPKSTANSDMQSLICKNYEANELVFLYRKNIADTIFSGLIKHYYYDNALRNLEFNNITDVQAVSRLSGHNLDNMPVLHPQQIEITQYSIYGILSGIIGLFKFYHQELTKFNIHNVIMYEDVIESGHLDFYYNGSTHRYYIDTIPDNATEITEVNHRPIPTVEQPMNYGQYSKSDYFTNSELVYSTIRNIVNAADADIGLKASLDKLGVIY